MTNKKHTPLSEKIKAVESYASGLSIEDISRIYNIGQTTFYAWLRKIKKKSDYSVLENKHGGGAKKIFDEVAEQKLLKMILNPASSYGFEDDLWSLKRILFLCESELNLKISSITVWRLLRRNDFFYRSPEKNYHEGDKEELKIWLEQTFPKILKEVNKKQGILYFLDESNIKMTANAGKTWMPKDNRTVIKVTGKRGSISALSAISKAGHLLFNVYDGTIKAEDVAKFLEYMLSHHKSRHLFILMDNATVHHAKIILELEKKNKRLHIFHLPKYWPKYNPDEFVWNYLKNIEMKSYSAKDIKNLMDMVVAKLTKISNSVNTILGIFMRCPLSSHVK